ARRGVKACGGSRPGCGECSGVARMRRRGEGAAMGANVVSTRLERRLACHRALFDPAIEPRNRLRWLPELRHWQAARLREGFARFLGDPLRRPAAEFFLTDVYGDHDFSRRDADIARVLPAMQTLLPASLLETVGDGIALGSLTHALDLRMAQALHAIAPNGRR